MSQGTSGGVSTLFARPAFQRSVSTPRDSAHRLVPDIAAAVADPFTGVRIVYEQQPRIGGGTSQAAPIWAALTVLMNQYLQAHGGKPVGDINPLSEPRRDRSCPDSATCTLAVTPSTSPVPGMTW